MNKTLIKYHVVENHRYKDDCDYCDIKKSENGCPFFRCPLVSGYYFKKNKL